LKIRVRVRVRMEPASAGGRRLLRVSIISMFIGYFMF
jgi:hypothetical protein